MVNCKVRTHKVFVETFKCFLVHHPIILFQLFYPIGLISELGHFGVDVSLPVEGIVSARYAVWGAREYIPYSI